MGWIFQERGERLRCMSVENVELARRGYEALRRGESAAIAELLAEEVKWHGGDPDGPGACRNREQALRFINRAGRGDPGDLVEIIDAGKRVVVILQPPPVDGELPPRRAQVTSFRQGRIVEMVGYETVAEALAAAGVATRPSDPPPATPNESTA